MTTPKFPHIAVTIPADATSDTIFARVQQALVNADEDDAAVAFAVETEKFRQHPDALTRAARHWVDVNGGAGSASSGSGWSSDPFGAPRTEGERWQYAVVNVGMFNSPQRMADVLGRAGAAGWELITVYDKASNWLSGMEKGFMLLKRQVADGENPTEWCVQLHG